MKNLMFISLLIIPFCKAADSSSIRLLSSDNWAVQIDADLYPYSEMLKNLIKDWPRFLKESIPFDNFDRVQLRQLYDLLIFAKHSGIEEDLLSKEYTMHMSPNKVKQNEDAIINLASNFKNIFFSGKDKLEVEDQCGRLTDLYRIADYLEIYPALAAIAELRAQPENAFKIELLRCAFAFEIELSEEGVSKLVVGEDQYPDIPSNLQDLMAKRIGQREYSYSHGDCELGVMVFHLWKGITGDLLK